MKGIVMSKYDSTFTDDESQGSAATKTIWSIILIKLGVVAASLIGAGIIYKSVGE
jgi:hypothetical protein